MALYLSTESTQNVPVFFFAYAIVMIVSRPAVGVLADRVNRRPLVIPLMVVFAAGLGSLALSPSLPAAIAAAILCGVGYGSLNPTLLALVVDVAKPRERGAAMATYMSATDIGIAIGSTVLGVVAQVAGCRSVFAMGGAVVVLGLVYFLLYLRFSPRRQAAPDLTP